MPAASDGVSPIIRVPLGLWRQAGWVGVDLFFVLSGFLVSGLLFAEHAQAGGVRVRRFLARRALRIYPPFYVLLAFSATIHAASGHLADAAPRLFAEALYAQNYWPGLYRHTWSLAVEEHFYLLLALAVVGGRHFHLGAAAVMLGGAGLVVAVTALRIVTVALNPENPADRLFPTHLRIDSLLIGVLVAFCYHRHRDALLGVVRRWRRHLIIASAALLTPPVLLNVEESPGLVTVGVLGIALGFAGVLMLTLAAESPRAAPWHLLAAVGRHSYAIYLWHALMVIAVVGAFRGMNAGADTATYLLAVAAYLSSSVGLGVLLSRRVDQPVLALRDRWLPSRARAGGLPHVHGAPARRP